MKRKILIDCDPGLDDGVALLLLESMEQLDVVAVTACFGSSNVENTFENAKRIAFVLGMDAVIACGAAEPVITGNESSRLCSLGWCAPEGSEKQRVKKDAVQNVSNRHAWDVIYETAVRERDQLEIITFGPLTNLAVALLKYEDLRGRIKSLTIMGGSAGVGNVTAFGEANVLWDPYAFQVVLQSGIVPMVMVGLDAAQAVSLTEEEFLAVFHQSSCVSTYFLPLLMKEKDRTRLFHAVAAAVAGAFPEFIETKPYHVAVELGENGQYGRTVIDARLHATADRNVNVVQNVDKKKVLDYLENAWIYYQ